MYKQPDYATGKLVDLRKPEEIVRQNYEKELIHGRGYPKDNIDIEVNIRRGTKFFREKADIVIYRTETERDQACDIEGIVETKAPRVVSGMDQLKSYMTATSAKWGVWTNGTKIRFVCRDPKDYTRILDNYIYSIPAYGQNISDLDTLPKSMLKPFARGELKLIFSRLLNSLYANASISRRDQLGSEMIKLIFAKIEDETTYYSRPPDFRIQAGEDPEQVLNRINKLFTRVKKTYEKDNIYNDYEEISLDARSIAEVVGQLEHGSLTKTDSDVVGDAFEVFAESKLAGERGQFFTPRGVVKLAVKLTNPQPDQDICDPACGSGGFLIHVMRHLWNIMDSHDYGKWGQGNNLTKNKRRIASNTIFGVDKELDLVKIAKAYMTIAGDGKANIQNKDSLDYIDNQFEGMPAEFDVILTNPPFGTKTKIRSDKASKYNLGHAWKKDKDGTWKKISKPRDSDPYLLFLELCIANLKRHGKLAIVLPETVFHAPKLGYVRQYIRKQCSVDAIIDLPHNTFRPHCNAKTCLIVLSKGKPQGDIVFAVPKEMGHDLQGKPLYRREDTTQLWDDLAIVQNELDDPLAAHNQFTLLSPPRSILDDDCWVPRYQRSIRIGPTIAADCYGISLGDLQKEKTLMVFDGHGSPRASEKGFGSVPYIRVKDVINWELYHDPTAAVTEAERKRLGATKRPIEIDDIILVRRGSYRIGSVAITGPRDIGAILTRELLTLRVIPSNHRQLTPAYLLTLLSTSQVQDQIPDKVCVDTTLPNLGNRWRSVILPIHKDPKAIKRIDDLATEIIEERRNSLRRINNDLSKLAGPLRLSGIGGR